MERYNHCTLCPRKCHIDRREARGACGMGDTLTIARASLHDWEEPCISGERGSGTIFFSGCPLGCIYCQNREIAKGEVGLPITADRLLAIFYELEAAGAHNINLVTPTHFVPTIAVAIRKAKAAGFMLPFVYNTSGYESVETLKSLAGLIDIYLTDMRYATPILAKAFSCAEDYPEIAKASLAEMVAQTGAPVYDAQGMMLSGTIVRFLLLPGHVIDAKLRLHQVYAAHGEQVVMSLMRQYTPMAGMPAPLNRSVRDGEYQSFVDYALALGITHAYTQEDGTDTASFIPKFDYTGVLSPERSQP